VSSSGHKGSTIYGVYLFTDSASVNLTGGNSSGRTEKDKVADAINAYIINSAETHFNVPYPTPSWLFALIAVFPLIGLALLCVRNVYVLVDKVSQIVTIRRTGLLKTDESILPVSEIKNVIIEESKSSRGVKSYRLAFALKEKPALPLILTYDSALEKKRTIAKALNEFMNKPLSFED
jgi:hypothetical protein